jgi:hypothetical protein
MKDSLVEPVEVIYEMGLQVRCRHLVRVGLAQASGVQLDQPKPARSATSAGGALLRR